jgi:hypothetical protein
MMDNIEKVLDRGEKIELLVDKTESLQFLADSFQQQGRQLGNLRIKLIIGGVILSLIIIASAFLDYFLFFFLSHSNLLTFDNRK